MTVLPVEELIYSNFILQSENLFSLNFAVYCKQVFFKVVICIYIYVTLIYTFLYLDRINLDFSRVYGNIKETQREENLPFLTVCPNFYISVFTSVLNSYSHVNIVLFMNDFLI